MLDRNATKRLGERGRLTVEVFRLKTRFDVAGFQPEGLEYSSRRQSGVLAQRDTASPPETEVTHGSTLKGCHNFKGRGPSGAKNTNCECR